MIKQDDVTIDELVKNAETLKGRKLSLTGYLGRHNFSDNFSGPTKIIIYGDCGQFIEFDYSKPRQGPDAMSFALEIMANCEQPVHAEVYVCPDTGGYRLNRLQLHKKSRTIPENEHAHISYSL